MNITQQKADSVDSYKVQHVSLQAKGSVYILKTVTS